MTPDPAARSVRVALALCDRFVELLKGPSEVRAVKRQRALFGVSGNQEDLSLRIGEAQQLYPEIWRHLDDAHAAFRARGIEIPEYAQLRAVEGNRLGANVTVKHIEHRMGVYGADEIIKNAGFNDEGARRARAAGAVIMHATPQIDWAALARAEADDPAAAAFARASTMRKWRNLALLGALFAAPFAYVLYTHVVPHGHHAASTAEPALDDHGYADAVTPAHLLAVTPGTEPCPQRIEAPAQAAADRFIHDGAIDEAAFRSSNFYAYSARRPVDVGAPFASGDVPFVALVIIDRDHEPDADHAGAVVGRSFLYSVRDTRMICAGTIDAHTGAYDGGPTGSGHRALEVEIRKQLASGLRATASAP